MTTGLTSTRILYAWVKFSKWPKPLHHGLRNTLQSKVNLRKLETVFQVIDLL